MKPCQCHKQITCKRGKGGYQKCIAQKYQRPRSKNDDIWFRYINAKI